ncbi:Protein farnesyltransferase subunit beta [Anthophora retusa]
MSNSMEPQIRTFDEILEQKQDIEYYETASSQEQDSVERNVLEAYRIGQPILRKHLHILFLESCLTNLNEDHECLDCSRPWLCYWIIHSLQILGKRLSDSEYSKIAGFLAKCQSPEGGFGGGPGQYPHLASTYAAVNALCIIGTPQAYQVIDRKGLKRFLLSLRGEDGSFRLHTDGEADMRGVYCAAAVSKLTNVWTPEMFKETENWIAQCQTWEGGFGGTPGMEAHGGHTYCGLSALVLLEGIHLCCMKSLLRWIVNKQMRLEGGFQGRTNKLVDACYSIWLGGIFPLIHGILKHFDEEYNSDYWLFDQTALQEYLLFCCQDAYGGLLDKPKKHRDIYHTCHALCGLSVAQNSPKMLVIGFDGYKNCNRLEVIDTIFNIACDSVCKAKDYFYSLPIPD